MSYSFMADLTPEGKRFMRSLEQLDDLEVFVGLQSDQKYEDGTSMVDVAAFNEFGTSTIPARPFFKQSYENHRDELQNICAQAAKTVINGGPSDKALDMIGVFTTGLFSKKSSTGTLHPTPRPPSSAKALTSR